LIFPAIESTGRFLHGSLLLLVFVLTVASAAMCTPATRDFIFHCIFNRKQPAEPRY
jgi:hypothetical protein